MNKFNHGVEFQSQSKNVSFSEIDVTIESSSRDSLDESELAPFSPRKSEKKSGRKCLSILIVLFLILVLLCVLIKFSGIRNNSTTASLFQHRTIYDRCEDSIYGCCEVYDLCHLQEDNFTYVHELVFPFREMKYDRYGSNCPRMIEMVRKYNSHYYPSEDSNYECLDSEFGCCSIDVSCDQYVHFGIEISYPEEKKNINYSLYDISFPTIKNINLAKMNSLGTNCPTFHRVVLSYNQEYPHIYMGFIGAVFLLIGFLCCIPLSTQLINDCYK